MNITGTNYAQMATSERQRLDRAITGLQEQLHDSQREIHYLHCEINRLRSAIGEMLQGRFPADESTHHAGIGTVGKLEDVA